MGFNYQLQPGLTRKKKYRETSEQPLISVITPYYNSKAYFEQTFNCIINQTFPWFEWIIMDDGSTDLEDIRWLEKLVREDQRVRLYHKKNGGPAEARNLAVTHAKADLLFMMDSDDLIEANTMEMMYLSMLFAPQAAVCYSDIVTFGETEFLWAKEFSSEREKKENIMTANCAIRKVDFFEVGGYDICGRYFNEDWHLWLKLLSYGKQVVHLDLFLDWYRRREGGAFNALHKDPEQVKKNERMIREVAQHVPDGIRAIQFGEKNRIKEFEEPKYLPLDRKLPFAEDKTRILLLLPHMECGGADKFNLDILENLDKNKYELGVITTRQFAQNEWRQLFLQQTDDVFELPKFLNTDKWLGFIKYYIQSRDVKIVWNISSYFGYYAFPMLRIMFPEIAIIDCIHAEGRYWKCGGYPRASAALDSVIDRTFVTNDYTRRILVDRYGKDETKTRVIYTGINEAEFDPEQIEESGLRKELCIAYKRKIVLFLARIDPEKRPFLMLKIAQRVRTRVPDVCFLVVGGGPQLEAIKEQACICGLGNTVLFTGRVDDIKPYYKIADVFLLCSIKEGLSITTMEAMLMQVPVISADVGSQYELVGPNTGRLVPCMQDEEKDFDAREFPKEEIEAYSNAIIEVLCAADAQQMRKACRAKILDGFTQSDLMKTLDQEFSVMTATETMQKRQEIVQTIAPYRRLLQDFMTLYQTYETMEATAFELWKSKEWIHRQYTQLQTEGQAISEAATAGMPESLAEERLREIYAMRSWQLVQHLRRFVQGNIVGKLLAKTYRKVHVMRQRRNKNSEVRHG